MICMGVVRACTDVARKRSSAARGAKDKVGGGQETGQTTGADEALNRDNVKRCCRARRDSTFRTGSPRYRLSQDSRLTV